MHSSGKAPTPNTAHRSHRYTTVICFSPLSLCLYQSVCLSICLRSLCRPSKRYGISLKSRQKLPVSFPPSFLPSPSSFLIHPRCFIPPSPRTRQQKKRGQPVDTMCFLCHFSDPPVVVEHHRHPPRRLLSSALPRFSLSPFACFFFRFFFLSLFFIAIYTVVKNGKLNIIPAEYCARRSAHARGVHSEKNVSPVQLEF